MGMPMCRAAYVPDMLATVMKGIDKNPPSRTIQIADRSCSNTPATDSAPTPDNATKPTIRNPTSHAAARIETDTGTSPPNPLTPMAHHVYRENSRSEA